MDAPKWDELMARIRTIKPGFFTSLTVAGLSKQCRLTFIGLWTYVDDAGRGVDDTRLVKAEIWPLDDDVSLNKVDADLKTLDKAELIERYIVDGRRYLRIRSWSEHQRINRPTASKLPLSPEETVNAQCVLTEPSQPDSVNPHGALIEGSPPEGKGREVEGKGSVLSLPTGTTARRQPADETRATEPTNGNHPARPPDELADRLHDVVHGAGGRGPAADHDACVAVVCHLRQHVDSRVIDERIGYCATLDQPPKTARYLLTVTQRWMAERGQHVPDMPAANGTRR